MALRGTARRATKTILLILSYWNSVTSVQTNDYGFTFLVAVVFNW